MCELGDVSDLIKETGTQHSSTFHFLIYECRSDQCRFTQAVMGIQLTL